MNEGVVVEPAAPRHERALLGLFAQSSCPCYCRYWHFEGTNNAWLERCATQPDENAAELAAALATASEEARGVVAVHGEGVIGWMKLARAEAMTKLTTRKLYKGLPCLDGDRSGVVVVGCCLVDPAHRRQGVAAALLRGAVDVARSIGARAIEAYPRVSAEPLHDEELWNGPASTFFSTGFREVGGARPYPVLRLDLAG